MPAGQRRQSRRTAPVPADGAAAAASCPRRKKYKQKGVLHFAAPPCKLPKVFYDFGQLVAYGRLIEREGGTLMEKLCQWHDFLTLPLLPKLICFSIVTTFFYYAADPFYVQKSRTVREAIRKPVRSASRAAIRVYRVRRIPAAPK